MNKIEISDWLKKLQDTICNDLEIVDDGSKFEEEIWVIFPWENWWMTNPDGDLY